MIFYIIKELDIPRQRGWGAIYVKPVQLFNEQTVNLEANKQ